MELSRREAAEESGEAQVELLSSSNKLLAGDRAVHDWYRFVLSFPPHLVQHYLRRFGLTARHCVLDPFCGTGTTLVECKKSGIPSVGIEANRMAYLASTVKTTWDIDTRRLLDDARKVYDGAIAELRRTGLEDAPGFFGGNTAHPGLRGVSAEQDALLLRGSISPLPLHKALVLLDYVRQSGSKYVPIMELCFAKAVVASASNLHFGPEVGVRKAKTDAEVLGPWLQCVRTVCEDAANLKHLAHVPSKVILGDARQPEHLLERQSIDFIFTSPPYPNEKDYTRATRLESVLLGLIPSKEELRRLKQGLLRSNTRGVYRGDDDDERIRHHPRIMEIADEIEARRQSLGKTSGFERMYARVTKLYFGGMLRHLEGLSHVLRPGAVACYVVGDQASFFRVKIDTGTLIAEIASALGYETLGIDLFRTRPATATGEQLREEVVLLRWPG